MRPTTPLLASLVALLSLFSPLASAQPFLQASPDQEMEVRFSRPLEPEELISTMNELGLRPLELYYQTDAMTAGYTLSEGEPIESAILGMEQKHREFLEAAIEAVRESREATQDRIAIRGFSKLDREFNAALEELNAGSFSIRAIKVQDGNAATPLLKSGLVESITTAPGRELRQHENELRSITSPSAFHESWAPYKGTAQVTRKLTFQTFYFNSLSGFTAWTAYEQETQVYDLKFADYDNYWASNMPKAYKDTQAGDSNGVDNFAVGSTAPTSFQKDYQYYTYMALRSGGSTTVTPTVRIKGQLGNKIYGCHSWTWCVLKARATTGSLITLTAPISSARSWSY